jgi:PAS domain S-box-containing protein
MARSAITPSGVESPFDEDELIVSKTDLKGRLTYVNDVFLRVSKYGLKDMIGAPHSVIRHPDMPRCIFKLLWDTIQAKKEIFAYVVNLARNGDHYWVLAHVTPSLDAQQNVVGYHSNRRKPDKERVAKVKALYAGLVAEENRHENRKDGMTHAAQMLNQMLKERGIGYDEFVFSL